MGVDPGGWGDISPQNWGWGMACIIILPIFLKRWKKNPKIDIFWLETNNFRDIISQSSNLNSSRMRVLHTIFWKFPTLGPFPTKTYVFRLALLAVFYFLHFSLYNFINNTMGVDRGRGGVYISGNSGDIPSHTLPHLRETHLLWACIYFLLSFG